MDVSFYLGELLMQRGEVKVPGLGNFLQVRMSAFYDENEGLFYPPFNKVHFEPQADGDDTTLAGYLAREKGISFASAQYFIEKYIANIRQQAILADVPVGNMGVFYIDKAGLAFKPNDSLIDDPELYGYAPVKINKVNPVITAEDPQIVSETVYPLVNAEPEATETLEETIPEPLAEEESEDQISSTDENVPDLPEEEEEESRGPLRAILITLFIVAVLAAGVFALYRYQPATFNNLQFWKNNKPAAPVKISPKPVAVPKVDTLHTDSIKPALNDSAALKADTLKKPHFELIVNGGYKTLAQANEAIKRYRSIGLVNAKLSEDIPGRRVKVTVGSFNSVTESEAARQKWIKQKKLTKYARTIQLNNE
jgi:hypothetical protein